MADRITEKIERLSRKIESISNEASALETLQMASGIRKLIESNSKRLPRLSEANRKNRSVAIKVFHEIRKRCSQMRRDDIDPERIGKARQIRLLANVLRDAERDLAVTDG